MIGVLAYGSLITDPGPELDAVTVDTITGVPTPFRVEFARSSGKRGGAPTLVPVEEGGSQVQAVIFEAEGSEREIADIVYRREIHAVGTGKTYSDPPADWKNAVRIERFEGLAGFDVVLATRIAANISPLSAEILADLAIASAHELNDGRDGISYLMAARASGIVTLLSPAYERAILEKTGATDLHAALHAIQIEAADRA